MQITRPKTTSSGSTNQQVFDNSCSCWEYFQIPAKNLDMILEHFSKTKTKNELIFCD